MADILDILGMSDMFILQTFHTVTKKKHKKQKTQELV